MHGDMAPGPVTGGGTWPVPPNGGPATAIRANARET
jgi:hypothetical protein